MQIDFDTSIRAIAHPLRRKILEWLKDPALHFPEQEYGQNLGVGVGQITLRCGLSQSTVSRHLTVLKEAALIDLHKSGQVHFFKRNEKLIQSLNSSLKKLLQDEQLGGRNQKSPRPQWILQASGQWRLNDGELELDFLAGSRWQRKRFH
jgi:ArsR family transcriptional regulator